MDEIDPTPAQASTGCPAVASTSSTPPEESPLADPIAEIGERILAELGAAGTNDTLTRWLCHHTAGLLDAADRAAKTPDADARAAAAREAILRLWQHRSAWPNGWPPPHAVEIVRLLDDLPSLDDTSWHQDNVPNRLHYLHHQVLATLCDLVTTNRATVDNDTVEQGWLEAFGDRLTPDESTLLARAAGTSQRLDSLLSWWDLAAAHDTALTTDEETATTTDAANNTLNGRGSIVDTPVDATPAHPLAALANAYRDTILSLLRPAAHESDSTTNNDKISDKTTPTTNNKTAQRPVTDNSGDAVNT